MNYKLLDGERTTYAIVFEPGDEVVHLLNEFARERRLKASHLTAIGAFRHAVIGFYDFEKKDYTRSEVTEQVEVLIFSGNISLHEEDSIVHIHTVLGRRDYSTLGGHLLEGYVDPTLEVILKEEPGYLQRRLDERTGLPLIVID